MIVIGVETRKIEKAQLVTFSGFKVQQYLGVLRNNPIVALSSCEAKYVAVAYCAYQGVWLKSLIEELHMSNEEKVNLFVDNQSTIKLAKNPVSDEKSEHIDVKFHHLRDQVYKKKIELIHYMSEVKLALVLIKFMKIGRFLELRDKLGIV